MITTRTFSFATLALVLACNDSGSSSSGDDTTTAGTTGGTAPVTGDSTTAATMTTNAVTTAQPDSSGEPPANCREFKRNPLHEGLACTRVMFGDIDNDGFGDVVAFGQDPAADAGPTTTIVHTFLGDHLGLRDAQVHCCVDATGAGHGEVFDLNGDTRGDPIYVSSTADGTGRIAKLIRAPEGGYTANTDLAAPLEGTAAFTVGRIMAQTFGVIIVADGLLTSNIGNGTGLGLETVATLELDPSPVITQLVTMEIDGGPGTDLVGLGPDGLYIWSGTTDGVFSQATMTALPGTYTQMQKVDLDLDSHDSLVLAGPGEPVAIVDGDFAGGYTVNTAGTPMQSPPFAVVEVDNDLQPDIVGADGNNLVMYAGDGQAFGEQVVLTEIGTAADIGFTDIDGNGRSDVVACDELGLMVVYSPDV